MKDILGDLKENLYRIRELFQTSLEHDNRFTISYQSYEGTADIFFEGKYIISIATVLVASIEEGAKRRFGFTIDWRKYLKKEWEVSDYYYRASEEDEYYPIRIDGVYVVKKRSELIETTFIGDFNSSCEYLLKYSLNFNSND